MLRIDLLEYSIGLFIVRVNVLSTVGGSGLARIVLQVMIEHWVTWELGVRLSACEALQLCLVIVGSLFFIPGGEGWGGEGRGREGRGGERRGGVGKERRGEEGRGGVGRGGEERGEERRGGVGKERRGGKERRTRGGEGDVRK